MSKIFLISKSNLWSNKLYDLIQSEYDCSYFNDNSYVDSLSQKPDWIFFFHWSEIVPKEILDNSRCVVIHTGNLPKGRGGSPLQNQILDGVVGSKVNAIVMTDELDGFLDVGNFRLEFSRSEIDGNEILSDVKIRRVDE